MKISNPVQLQIDPHGLKHWTVFFADNKRITCENVDMSILEIKSE